MNLGSDPTDHGNDLTFPKIDREWGRQIKTKIAIGHLQKDKFRSE